jgi:hypothetical protein
LAGIKERRMSLPEYITLWSLMLLLALVPWAL